MKEQPFAELNLRSWEEFEDAIGPTLDKSRGMSGRGSLYRGQEDSSWPLATTLARVAPDLTRFEDYYRVISTIRPEIESITHEQWAIEEYPDVAERFEEYEKFSLDLTFGRYPAYAYLIYLRHHGFPSPLLDWSRSPYIAAYFAFSRCAGNRESSVSIFAFEEDRFHPGGNEMPMVYRMGPYVKTDRRHFLQQSEYTLCVRYDAEWCFAPYEVASFRGQGAFTKFNLPGSERLTVLKLLERFNLNAYSLFGTEDALIETIARRELEMKSSAAAENSASESAT